MSMLFVACQSCWVLCNPLLWLQVDSRFAPSQWERPLLCNDVSLARRKPRISPVTACPLDDHSHQGGADIHKHRARYIIKFSLARLPKFYLFFNADYIWFRRKLCPNSLARLVVLLASDRWAVQYFESCKHRVINTNWPSFCRRHVQIHFLVSKLLYFESIFTQICS